MGEIVRVIRQIFVAVLWRSGTSRLFVIWSPSSCLAYLNAYNSRSCCIRVTAADLASENPAPLRLNLDCGRKWAAVQGFQSVQTIDAINCANTASMRVVGETFTFIDSRRNARYLRDQVIPKDRCQRGATSFHHSPTPIKLPLPIYRNQGKSLQNSYVGPPHSLASSSARSSGSFVSLTNSPRKAISSICLLASFCCIW
jgi:hypothetical protein